MGFSLSNLLKQGAAQVNPFDHGQTAATVRAQQATPPPATLPTPGTPGFGVLAPGHVAMPQPSAPHPSFADNLSHAVKETMGGFGLGVGRAGIGLAQAGSGLYDLAGHEINGTPLGTTNRFDKVLDKGGKALDNLAPKVEPDAGQAGYKIGQVSANLASFLIPGTAEAKAVAAIPRAAKIADVVDHVAAPITNVIDRGAARLAEKGASGRIASTALKEGTSKTNMINAAAGTAQDAGTEASHGQVVTPQSVATDAATNVLFGTALPTAGAVLREAAPTTRLVTNSAKAVGKARSDALFREAQDQTAATQQRQINQARKELTGRLKAGQAAGLPDSHPAQQAVYKGLKELDQRQLNISSPAKRTVSQKVTDKLLTSQPGLSMRRVDDNGNPLPNQPRGSSKKISAPAGDAKVPAHLDDYHTMYADSLRQMDQSFQGGNKYRANPNGSPVMSEKSPFFRKFYQENGKAPTKADYKTEAVRQLESGKADSYAQEEYNQLKATPPPAAPAPVVKPTTNLVSQVTKDNIAAKKQALADKMSLSDTPITDTSTPLPTGKKVVENRLTTGAKEGRQNVGPEVQKAVKGSHAVRSTDKLAANAAAEADKVPTEQFTKDTFHALDEAKLGDITDKHVAQAHQAIERADASGDFKTAVQIHDKLSEHLVKQGQSIQAASLLYRLSPQGIFYKAMKDLKQAGNGKAVPDGLQTELRAMAKKITDAADPAAKTRATAEFNKKVADNMPRGKLNDVLSVWKAGLLSGVKTQQGNALSNTIFAGLKKISDLPAAAIDHLISLGTHERTKVATLRGSVSGAKEGFGKGVGTLRTGIDERNITDGGKLEQHGELNFKNPIIQNVFGKPSNLVFRGMSAADQPFYYAAAKNNLYDQAMAQSKTRGLSGMERDTFVNNLVKNPTKQMAQTAKDAADKSVLGYDTVGSKAIQAIHTAIDNFKGASPAGKAGAHAAVSILAPFVKVPTAFISRTIDFTPAGPFKQAIRQISNKHFDQRALSEALGEGITGTGIIGLGMALSHNNLISGDFPKNDQKEQARWKAEGITPNSVKIGNQWINMNYLGPVGLLFNAGHQMMTAKSPSATGKASAAIAGLGQGLMGQSFLQGFSGFSDAIKDPARNAKSFVNSQASSVVPAWVNDIANASDKWQRQADTVPEAIKNRVPGLREGNKVKQDVYGNPLEQASGQANTLNGLKPSDSLTGRNTVLTEVNRLHLVNPDDTNLQVTPTPIGKSVNVDNKNVPLNDNQRYELQHAVGQLTQQKWGELIKTDAYQALDDQAKAKALGNLRTDASTLATRDYVTKNNLGTYSKAATNKQSALASGADVSSYADVNGSGITISSKLDPGNKKVLADYMSMNSDARSKKADSDPGFEYQVAAAKYANDTANGKLSKTEDIRAQASLAKAQVGASFDKQTRDLYGLSKPELYSLITTDPNGKQMAADALAYGDALASAGIEKNKFRTSGGAVSFTPKAVGSGGSSSSKKYSLFGGSGSGTGSVGTLNSQLREILKKARLA